MGIIKQMNSKDAQGFSNWIRGAWYYRFFTLKINNLTKKCRKTYPEC